VVSKRVSLKDRKAQGKRGVDVLLDPEPDTAASDAPKLTKVTMYVRPSQVAAVESIQLNERKRTGSKPDKSDLYQEALDLLLAKYKVKE
jgi:hypothetical protein